MRQASRGVLKCFSYGHDRMTRIRLEMLPCRSRALYTFLINIKFLIEFNRVGQIDNPTVSRLIVHITIMLSLYKNCLRYVCSQFSSAVRTCFLHTKLIYLFTTSLNSNQHILFIVLFKPS